jgi:hypothetical protein
MESMQPVLLSARALTSAFRSTHIMSTSRNSVFEHEKEKIVAEIAKVRH